MESLCVEAVEVCDRVYDCFDRRDEDNCVYVSTGNSSDNLSYLGLNAIQWTLSILAMGVPIVCVIYVSIRKLILSCGIPPEHPGEESSVASDEASPVTEESRIKELNRVLDFIMALDRALDETKPDKENLIQLYNDIHDSHFWLQNLRAFFEIVNLICEKDEYKIVAFCSILRELEMEYHEGNVLHMDLCLKDNLGYRFSALFYWNAEPPTIRNCYLKLTPPKCFSLIRSQCWKGTSIILGVIGETLGHFIDLIRDWVLFFFLWNLLSVYHDGSVPWREEDGQILIFYGFILLFPEFVLSGIYYGRNYRSLYGIRDETDFRGWVKVLLFSSCILTAPFLPGYLLISRCQLALSNMKIQGRIWSFLELYFKDKSNKDSNELLNLMSSYEENRESRLRIKKVLNESKHLEASTETFFHFALQVILLISINFESNFGSPVLEIFGAHKDTVSALLYINFAFHFSQLTVTRVQIESASKMGFFPDLAKLIFYLFSAFALGSKILAIILFFGPSLGFFGLSLHFDRGTAIPFNEALGRNVTFLSPEEERTDYTLLNLSSYYVLFLTSIPLQLASLWIIKFNTTPRFKKFTDGSLLHLFNCLSFPGIFKDWDIVEVINFRIEDEEVDESLEPHLQTRRYRRQFTEVKREALLTVLWHSLVNALLTIPTMYNSIQVIQKHLSLQVDPLDDEVQAYVSAWCLLIIPQVIFTVLQPLSLHGLISLYYNKAHPWARILANSK